MATTASSVRRDSRLMGRVGAARTVQRCVVCAGRRSLTLRTTIPNLVALVPPAPTATVRNRAPSAKNVPTESSPKADPAVRLARTGPSRKVATQRVHLVAPERTPTRPIHSVKSVRRERINRRLAPLNVSIVQRAPTKGCKGRRNASSVQ